MAWIKNTVGTLVTYLPPPELIGLVVKVVHDTKAKTWSIVYTEAGTNLSVKQIETNMGL